MPTPKLLPVSRDQRSWLGVMKKNEERAPVGRKFPLSSSWWQACGSAGPMWLNGLVLPEKLEHWDVQNLPMFPSLATHSKFLKKGRHVGSNLAPVPPPLP